MQNYENNFNVDMNLKHQVLPGFVIFDKLNCSSLVLCALHLEFCAIALSLYIFIFIFFSKMFWKNNLCLSSLSTKSEKQL